MYGLNPKSTISGGKCVCVCAREETGCCNINGAKPTEKEENKQQQKTPPFRVG